MQNSKFKMDDGRSASGAECGARNGDLYHLPMIIGRLEKDAHFHYAPPLPVPLLQTEFGGEGEDALMKASGGFEYTDCLWELA
jgi:hypothetical protein